MLADQEYHFCMRQAFFNDHICNGRLTLEHAFIHAGKQINEKWAIISICAWAHDVDEWQDAGNLDKDKNQYIALARATPEELEKYKKTNWEQLYNYLIGKYGIQKRPTKFELF